MIEPIEKAPKTWVLALTSVASLVSAHKPMKAAAARSARYAGAQGRGRLR